MFGSACTGSLLVLRRHGLVNHWRQVWQKKQPQQSPQQCKFYSTNVGTERYQHERELLLVKPCATPEELKECYMVAVEAAKQQAPGPLLQLKVAELSQAFETGSYEDSTTETTPAEHRVEDASQPEWVKQQSEIKRAVALATANLNDVEGDSTAAVREASFRKAVARINQMTKEYNLNVPMERFQRPVYSEKRIDTLVKQAAN
eukprot:gene6568-32193_t